MHELNSDHGRILLVDDDTDDLEYLSQTFRCAGYEVLCVQSGADALRETLQFQPDLIITDLMMQGMDGFEFTSFIKNNPKTAAIPIVLLTGIQDEGSRLKGLALGAEDFATKDGNHQELRYRVRNLVRLKQAYDRLVSSSRLLKEIDHTTELPNQAAFVSQVKRDIAGALNSGDPVAVLIIELDHRDKFRSGLGPNNARLILREIAKRLSFVDDSVLWAHLDRECFGGILQGSEAAAMDLATRVGAGLARKFRVADVEVSLTVSQGVAVFEHDRFDWESLLQHAETALSVAKREGGNAYRLYEPSMTSVERDSIVLEAELRNALAGGDLSLHYQPQVSLRTGNVIGMEALMRWSHGSRGMIAPGRFIPMAERCGLIAELGHWALHDICTQVRTWQDLGLEVPRVALNLSPIQFVQEDLVERVMLAVEQAGIAPNKLELEITEGATMHNVQHAIDKLKCLKDFGVQLSLDDFGTGYSSLSYLKQFSLDTLKIDQSFVRELSSDSQSQAITRSVSLLAHELGMEVIAEGVEHPDQLKFLQDIHCNHVQGFYFARPTPAGDIPEWFRTSRHRFHALLN